MTGFESGQASLSRLAAFYGAAVILCAELFSVAAPAASELPGNSTVAVTIDAEHLIELYQYVPNLLIVDSRHREDFALGHIETAISLPLADTNCKSLSRLAKSTEQAMVFYSNNNAGDASIEAIRIAFDCGYKRLFWLRDGFVEWKGKDYPYVIE